MGRCQIECVVYKVEELNPNSNSNNRNDKRVCGFNERSFSNKYITIIKVASHMKYIDIKLVCPTTYAKSKQIWYRSYIKIGNRVKM